MGRTTIGVAIDIPQPWGGELTAARLAAGDPVAQHVPAHVTLLGPTEVDAAVLPAIDSHLAAVARAHRPFTVRLRGTGTFRPITQVVFVAVAAGIGECEQLHTAVLACAAIVPAAKFPYHPHVTIAQNVDPARLDAAFADLAGYEAAFAVDGFTLFEHDDGGRWRPHAEYRLTAEH
ncbi:2'-5' RNA ligase family protein [Dactylosporangium vinaceum]|uniref:2'-5' RNA ligase family protein n=1 Tax=Dactylosporangium vinaceum TaxID=53362 RepID=A0ABV5MI10_9ACTN|nr:2'-5' RNA ligase family protein [Dactylosporangium vinaceum]UAB97462.1 2'-5' RNA ligase family protein [Dactylosporangium vinaceum]